jgi:hypothetical protein
VKTLTRSPRSIAAAKKPGLLTRVDGSPGADVLDSVRRLIPGLLKAFIVMDLPRR